MRKFVEKYILDDIESSDSIFYVQWHITSLCTESCIHCYLKKSEESIFKLHNSIELIDEISSIAEKNKLKCTIAFTGGDPLLHEGLFDLIEYAVSKRINVTIKGNPWLLDSSTIARLSRLNLKSYHISLDGIEKTHDLIRSKGSFTRTIKAIRDLKNADIRCLVKYTVSNMNSEEMKEVIDIANEAGADYFDFARLCPFKEEDFKYTFTPEKYAQFLMDVLLHYSESYRKGYNIRLLFRDHLWYRLFYDLNLLSDLFLESQRGDGILGGCSAGKNVLVINYNGDVLPCAKLPQYVLGNIMTDQLDCILERKKTDKLSRLSFYTGCSKCKLVKLCRGCPALSNAYYNSPFEKDPQCWHVI